MTLTNLLDQRVSGFEQEFKNHHAIFKELSKKAEDLIEQVVVANSYLAEVESEDATTNHQQHNKSIENNDEEETILPFSDITDKNGYNAKFLSADHIEAILESNFHDQKPLMQVGMQKLGGRIFLIDFTYSIASAIWVH
jgi:hypothetical protein